MGEQCPSTSRRVADVLVEMTLLPIHASEPREAIGRLAELSRDALGPGFHVSLTLGSPAQPSIVATTSKLAQVVDGAQVTADEGPCVTAWETREPVVAHRLHSDDRWQRLAQAVAEVPVGSTVAVPVLFGEQTAGALNVYGERPSDADDEHVGLALLLGRAVAATLHEIHLKSELAHLAHHLRQALESRSTIDQAKGMVMARYACGPDEAFDRLVQLSSRSNVKLRDVAARMVAEVSGSLPDAREA